MKLDVDLLRKAETEFPKSPDEVANLRASISGQTARELDGPEQYELRRHMIAASAREPAEIAFERYIGGDQLVSINYLAIGTLRSRPVGRISYFDVAEQRQAFATGFMVSPELLLTNHHVLRASTAAELSALVTSPVVEFDFEFDVNGAPCQTVTHRLEPDRFFHSDEALDIALVAVAPLDMGGTQSLDERGYLVLNGQIGKAGKGDYATIIQHPDGKEKEIALRENEVLDRTMPDVLIYKSDTAQGSSGAPVFNDEWQVIALHSAGVAKKDGDQYLDKNDQVIPVVDGRIDESRIVWISNRGIKVSAIMVHLAQMDAASHHPLLKIFSSPAYTDARPFNAPRKPAARAQEQALTSAPSNAVPPMPPIDIRITIGGTGGPVVQTFGGAAALATGFETEKKVEDEQDYSSFLGFDENFMGVKIPLPTPSAKLRKKLANLKDNPSSCVLKYDHYSTMQHVVRRVPVVSAINVHAKYRYKELGKGTRVDVWLRDNRIDYDAQLDDGWYAGSGLDRGHLSRREDGEWGRTLEAAKFAADRTCSYANAVPQVPSFNRANYKGLGEWGRLEDELLEKGVELESGKTGRLCVFSGPIFSDDDPIRKSVQVAMRCFKVVVWYDGTGALQTTAFILSQADLVGGIDWEVLHFDKVFVGNQHPLREIEGLTGLAFVKEMHDADTYVVPG